MKHYILSALFASAAVTGVVVFSLYLGHPTPPWAVIILYIVARADFETIWRK